MDSKRSFWHLRKRSKEDISPHMSFFYFSKIDFNIAVLYICWGQQKPSMELSLQISWPAFYVIFMCSPCVPHSSPLFSSFSHSSSANYDVIWNLSVQYKVRIFRYVTSWTFREVYQRSSSYLSWIRRQQILPKHRWRYTEIYYDMEQYSWSGYTSSGLYSVGPRFKFQLEHIQYWREVLRCSSQSFKANAGIVPDIRVTQWPILYAHLPFNYSVIALPMDLHIASNWMVILKSDALSWAMFTLPFLDPNIVFSILFTSNTIL
jgi:hypothetical protein